MGHYEKVLLAAVWPGPRLGERYLGILAEELEVQVFQPDASLVDGDNEMVLGHRRMAARATGRLVEAIWAWVWTLGDGKVIRYREYIHIAAWEAA